MLSPYLILSYELDLELMQSSLTDKSFVLVDTEEEANVVWPTRHIKDFVSLYNNNTVRIVNQFPNEKILTSKDLLHEICKR